MKVKHLNVKSVFKIFEVKTVSIGFSPILQSLDHLERNKPDCKQTHSLSMMTKSVKKFKNQLPFFA